MKSLFVTLLVVSPLLTWAQNDEEGQTFKKRVLESTEVSILSSYYDQKGDHAAVTGGIGNEKLNDAAGDISVAIPLNDDDILSIDGTISAYSSASSSNLNPFSGASSDDDNYYDSETTGTPWVQSSGASKSDVWLNLNTGYSHSSDDRNFIWGVNANIANEYDYRSLGGGFNLAKLWNEKNSEINIKFNTYLDQWKPQYPTEIHTYDVTGGNLNADFFNGVSIYDQNGMATNKNSTATWRPITTELIPTKKRNTYSTTLTFSQIINQKAQFSIFSDLVIQKGWLANPMQRVYFMDRPNYYIGNKNDIPIYASTENKGIFQLADDIERLPQNRLKIPIGTRFNYYFNEYLVLRTYYRYYYDDWDVRSNTINVELPIKLSDKFTVYPAYRYYNQSAAKYFAPYEEHVSTDEFYTSDYDLSQFDANQFGFGFKYTDLLTKAHISRLGLKNISLNYNYYQRSNNLKANIASLGFNFAVKKRD